MFTVMSQFDEAILPGSVRVAASGMFVREFRLMMALGTAG